MKVLVDRQTSLMRAAYEETIKFSTSGLFVVDYPDAPGTDPFVQDLSGLITQKINFYKEDHPLLPLAVYDEFFTSSGVDTALSSRYSVGANKRTAIRPGGVLMTQPFAVGAPLASITKLFFHFSLFTLYLDPGDPSAATPQPSKLLYNYDSSVPGFAEPNLADVTCHLMNAAGNTALTTLLRDTEQTFSSALASFRVRFTNGSASKTYYVSDWLTLFG
jgi:hypothetical protein